MLFQQRSGVCECRCECFACNVAELYINITVQKLWIKAQKSCQNKLVRGVILGTDRGHRSTLSALRNNDGCVYLISQLLQVCCHSFHNVSEQQSLWKQFQQLCRFHSIQVWFSPRLLVNLISHIIHQQIISVFLLLQSLLHDGWGVISDLISIETQRNVNLLQVHFFHFNENSNNNNNKKIYYNNTELCLFWFFYSAKEGLCSINEQSDGHVSVQSGGNIQRVALSWHILWPPVDYAMLMCCISVAQHLFSCELNGMELRTLADCVKRLKLLEEEGRVWGQSMLLEVRGPTLLLTDIETKVGDEENKCEGSRWMAPHARCKWQVRH